eukprot:888558-Prymnesium_polylepis.1
MTAQERSECLGPIGRRSFDFVLGNVNKRVHSDTCVCPTPPPTIFDKIEADTVGVRERRARNGIQGRTWRSTWSA